MNRTKTKRKRELFSVLLMLVLVGITIGYAALSTNLNINGTSKVSGNSWDIHFANVVVNPNSVTIATGNQAATINPSNTTEVTYSVTLDKPGDFYEFTVDAVNAGTVDGMIGTITSKLNGTVIDQNHPLPVYLDYSVTYSDGVEIDSNHLLKAGLRETYKIRLEFKRNISNEQLPSTDITPSFSFGVGFIQADNTAVSIPHTVVYTANLDSDEVLIGSPIPNTIEQYSNATDAKNAMGPGTFFILKHVISNNIVIESYLEFEITQEMASLDSNLTPGIYSIRGGVDESNQAEAPIFEANMATLDEAFGSLCHYDYNIDSYECGNSNIGFSVMSGINGYEDGINFLSHLDTVINSSGNSYSFISESIW